MKDSLTKEERANEFLHTVADEITAITGVYWGPFTTRNLSNMLRVQCKGWAAEYSEETLQSKIRNAIKLCNYQHKRWQISLVKSRFEAITLWLETPE